MVQYASCHKLFSSDITSTSGPLFLLLLLNKLFPPPSSSAVLHAQSVSSILTPSTLPSSQLCVDTIASSFAHMRSMPIFPIINLRPHRRKMSLNTSRSHFNLKPIAPAPPIHSPTLLSLLSVLTLWFLTETWMKTGDQAQLRESDSFSNPKTMGPGCKSSVIFKKPFQMLLTFFLKMYLLWNHWFV